MLRPLAILLLLKLLAPPGLAQQLEFNRDVRPILSDKCFKCHGPDAKNAKSDYRLDTFEQATARTAEGPGILPGDPEGSVLIQRLLSRDPNEQMPPPGAKISLNAEEIDRLRRWIQEGAEYQEHWAFVPLPEAVPVPAIESDWIRNEIDAFILSALQARGLSPSPETSREKWLRRVSFDLCGLPPSPEEIDAFLADASPEAYERVVDRLLASEACAERLAAEWLDVARYSDSYGYQVDGDRYVWPWRDWVIRAFRDKLPYDQFILWQLAGDLLPGATREQRLATAFNRLHPQNVEGGSVPEEFRVEYVSDRVHTYGTAFLGLTLECARCHDHKYDPITAKDYYALSAYFANIDEAGLYSFFTSSVPTPTLWLPEPAQEERFARLESEIAALEAALQERALSAQVDYESWRQHHPGPATPPAPLAAYSFDALEGDVFPNLVPGGEGAKNQVGNVLVPGRSGQAVRLSGDDPVTLPLGNFTRDDPFSVTLWLNAPEHSERAVVFSRSKAWTDAASRGYELLLEEGRLVAALVHYEPGNAIRIRSREKLPTGRWQHVALVYDGSSRAEGLRLYGNGAPLQVEVLRDKLSREITGGGSDTLVIGQRMRDSGFKNGLVDDFQVYDQALDPQSVRVLATGTQEPSPDLAHFLARHDPLSAKLRSELHQLRQERSELVTKIPEIMVMEELDGEPRRTHFLERGSYAAPREVVLPNTPAFLPPLPDKAPANRLGLAQWTVSPNHPLTARVTVNRYWQRLFQNGLVATSEDFGSQGRPPSHPELLDWLARDFIEHGWDLPRLLKMIVLSATYRQRSDLPSAEHARLDPENSLLYRYPAARLPAEMLRDNALAVSGLLVNQVGGPSVKPYDIALAFKPAEPDQGAALYRRSLYTYMRQTAPSPLMMALNASKRDVCQVRVEHADSPLEGLVMLNSPQFVEAARVLAAQLVARHSKDEALVRDAFRRLTSRLPTAEESSLLASLLAEQLAHFEADPGAATRLLAVGASPTATQQAARELARTAAAATLVSTLLNFDECVSKR